MFVGYFDPISTIIDNKNNLFLGGFQGLLSWLLNHSHRSNPGAFATHVCTTDFVPTLDNVFLGCLHPINIIFDSKNK